MTITGRIKTNEIFDFFLLFFITVINSGCVYGNYTVEGKSMLPTLKSGDVILATRDTNNLERGDIIVFNDPVKKDYIDICRIVGMPGEKIKIQDNNVFINNQLLAEPYILPENKVKNLNTGDFQVAQDSYFVLGDNRDHSKDSRSLGNIQKNAILGKYHSTLFNIDSE